MIGIKGKKKTNICLLLGYNGYYLLLKSLLW